MTNFFLPSEWHKQSGIQLTWPHKGTDWLPILAEVEECFLTIAARIVKHEQLWVVAPDVDDVKQKFGLNNISLHNVHFFECSTNDTWARDHAGITIIKDGKPVILDFKFNGWGLKFAANHDNLITSKMYRANCFLAGYENRLNFVFEGGAIESDGEGTLMTTAECLLSPNRNGEWNKQQIEDYLCKTFNADRVLWVNYGFLEGDDTDSHIDTLARFCSPDTIAYVKCEDETDIHFGELNKMEAELKTFKTSAGKPYRLLPLPMVSPVIVDGERLPATYANFLIINSAVLYPTYNQPENDKKAAEILQQAFPDREITGINCLPLIKQHGSLHCVTMQYPEGIF